MTERVVRDASALVALPLDSGADGRWATRALSGVSLVAPALLAFEAAQTPCRSELAGAVTLDQAAQAHEPATQTFTVVAPTPCTTAWWLRVLDAAYADTRRRIDGWTLSP